MKKVKRLAPWTLAAAASLLAMGGSAGAGSLLTGADVKDGTLTGADVRDGSLTAKDLAAKAAASTRGRRGPRGPRGYTGRQGPAGPGGPAGPQGPAGFAGVTQVAGPSTYMCSGGGGSCQVGASKASCPPGTKLVGGGWDGENSPPVDATVGYNTAYGEAWGVIMANHASIGASFHAVALCAAVGGGGGPTRSGDAVERFLADKAAVAKAARP